MCIAKKIFSIYFLENSDSRFSKGCLIQILPYPNRTSMEILFIQSQLNTYEWFCGPFLYHDAYLLSLSSIHHLSMFLVGTCWFQKIIRSIFSIIAILYLLFFFLYSVCSVILSFYRLFVLSFFHLVFFFQNLLNHLIIQFNHSISYFIARLFYCQCSVSISSLFICHHVVPTIHRSLNLPLSIASSSWLVLLSCLCSLSAIYCVPLDRPLYTLSFLVVCSSKRRS